MFRVNCHFCQKTYESAIVWIDLQIRRFESGLDNRKGSLIDPSGTSKKLESDSKTAGIFALERLKEASNMNCWMVAEVGLEPTRGCPRQILSLLWLPISPLGHYQHSIATKTGSVTFN